MPLKFPDRLDTTSYVNDKLAASFGLIADGGIHSSNDQQPVDTGGEVIVHEDNVFEVYPYHPYWAKIKKGTQTWTAEFIQAYVTDVAQETVMEVTLNTLPFKDAGKITVEDGDIYYLHVTTDTFGVMITATFEQKPIPPLDIPITEQHAEITSTDYGRAGDYWIKVVEFKLDDNGRLEGVYSLDHNVLWEYRPIHNEDSGDGEAFLLSRYEVQQALGGTYILRSLASTLDEDYADPGVIDELPTGSTLTLPVFVKAEHRAGTDIIDLFGRVEIPEGGSSSLPYTIYFSDFGILTLTQDVIYDLYDPDLHNNWSIEFEISADQLNATVAYNTEIERFPVNGAGEQTHYRLPVVRNGVVVSSGGCYQEDSMCDSGVPVIGLIKVG